MIKRLLAAIALVALVLPAGALADTQISAVGSTALLPLVKEAATEYATQHQDVKISVSGGGSYVGLAQARSGTAELGDSDVIAPGNSGLMDHKVAVVSFAIIVNPSSGITGLSAAQLRSIFSGRVTNWKDVGGADQGIVIINRPRTSGTRAVFNATMMGVSKINEAGLTVDSSGTVVTTVATTPGSISYVAVAYTRDKPVTVIKINGIAPTEANVVTGKYPVWSYEHIFTKGKPSPVIDGFIRYISSNQSLLAKLGYIPVSHMKVKETNR
ncbi:MAG TPA: phosphate ABC transporter substrate-binding protein [Candidatus Rubrimentiphilum sp.]|nr:phosphate ABC transporter substrate-binding protein [Candidatus Rubrimentiphilum sp.]